MYKLCCCERTKRFTGLGSSPAAPSGVNGSISSRNDAQQFDDAVAAHDIHSLVLLLESNMPIDALKERIHPWATDPRTVGALAAAQIAILVSTETLEDQTDGVSVKEDIWRSGGIKSLVNFLQSSSEDRVHIAAVALNFLLTDSVQNCTTAYDEGALPLLMLHLTSKVGGMRAAAASCLRHMSLANDCSRKEFVDSGGLHAIVALMSMSSNRDINQADLQIDSMENLQDLLEEDGEINARYAHQAISAGALDKLSKLAESQDDEVRAIASQMLSALAPFTIDC